MPITLIHQWNIALHGGPSHRYRGKAALLVMAISAAAALLGAIVFKGVVDLIGVSFLIGYQLYSASRPRNRGGVGKPPPNPSLTARRNAAGPGAAMGRKTHPTSGQARPPPVSTGSARSDLRRL